MSNFQWPAVPTHVPIHTIEREIANYASTHTQAGYMQLFYDFLNATRFAILSYGATGPHGKPLPSQILLSGFVEMINAISRKTTNEEKIKAMQDALQYLKTNYERLFPQNRLIGPPASVVPVDGFLVAKWRLIASGGSFASLDPDMGVRSLKERLAKLKYEGGAKRTHRKRAQRKRTKRAQRKNRA